MHTSPINVSKNQCDKGIDIVGASVNLGKETVKLYWLVCIVCMSQVILFLQDMFPVVLTKTHSISLSDEQ